MKDQFNFWTSERALNHSILAEEDEEEEEEEEVITHENEVAKC
jgi:hypothetical protein